VLALFCIIYATPTPTHNAIERAEMGWLYCASLPPSSISIYGVVRWQDGTPNKKNASVLRIIKLNESKTLSHVKNNKIYSLILSHSTFWEDDNMIIYNIIF